MARPGPGVFPRPSPVRHTGAAMSMSGAQVLAERKAYERLFLEVTAEDRAHWVRTAEFCRKYDSFLPWVRKKAPERYKQLTTAIRILAVEATHAEWRSSRDGVGGRPEQLLPGTPGSFSDRTDWRYWLLMGGRGSGKSRTGGEAIRELLFGTKWTTNVRVAFVGRTLDAVRTEMFINTFLQIVPPGSILAWRKQICELVLVLPNGRTATINGYSAERPDQLRGPNFHLAWGDETAAWKDADRGAAAIGTTWSNLNYAVRARASDLHGREWVPRIIATTTPKAVRLIRNLEPGDHLDPGHGIHDNPQTVVSSMSTLHNLDNLAPSFYEAAIEPYIGTRLYDQEVLGILMDEAVGAEWSGELIAKMSKPPSWPDGQGGGIVDVVIGVDPATIDDPENAEHGIIVSGLAADGNAYALEDASMRGRPSEVCERLAKLASSWGASCIVVEVNNGGSWISETMGRDYPNLPIVAVWAKRGKKVRSQPVALLSDRGRVFLAGSFPKLTHQMRTYTGDGPSPDRLDAFVYSILHLLPVEAQYGDLVTVISTSPAARR